MTPTSSATTNSKDCGSSRSTAPRWARSREVLRTAAGELLSMKADTDGREVLIPFVSAIVPSVSREPEPSSIDPPDGLLNLDLV